MKRVQEGDFDALIHLTYGEKEVVELANSYNIMLMKIKNLIEEKRLEHEAKRQSELNALQAQINPHFLYNTLDSIMWMAESGQNEEVVDMVTALARLFRISISKGHRTIQVFQELEHARNYMLIQKIRYKEKFTFNIEATDDVKQLMTLKLILQPIIENAIYHGIEYMVDKGEINIKVFIEGDKLIYLVEDNGLGMDEETRLALLHREEVEPTRGGSGVGVRNVDERIKLSYGDAYGLEIESEIEVGTTIRIILPKIEGDSNEV
jgi:two-component system sensor histidine kinase YesM